MKRIQEGRHLEKFSTTRDLVGSYILTAWDLRTISRGKHCSLFSGLKLVLDKIYLE